MPKRELPKHSLELLLKLGVCETYQHLGSLAFLNEGGLISDARKVIDVKREIKGQKISAGDRLWVVMRKEFTPDEVLRKVTERIFAFKDIPKKIKDAAKTGKIDGKVEHERLKEAFEAKEKEHYWEAISAVASCMKNAGIASYDQAYNRMLLIYREELDKWENET